MTANLKATAIECWIPSMMASMCALARQKHLPAEQP